MRCPRCRYEWDVRQSPCPSCSLHIRASGLQRSTDSQLPKGISPSDSSLITDFIGDGTVQVRSDYPREPTIDGRTPLPASSSRFQQSKFPLPSTGKLDPKRAILPLSGEAHGLSVQQAPSTLPSDVPADMQPLLPGTLLHRDRYRLHENLHKQEWPLGIVEAIWSAFDSRIVRSPVIIHELSIPKDVPKAAQIIPYTATKVFTSIGRNAHILALRDVFGDKGRSFFVFELVDGLSLLTLMSNNGRKLPEQEVVACCLQIVEILEICSRQSPPLIHGNIRPEYIVKKSTDSQYVMTNFSVALAGGLAQVMADKENDVFSPHMTDALMRGKMDGRTDLHALLSIAQYAVMGQGVSRAQMGSALSPQLHAILLKGLQAPHHQRYQKPSELYQDLLAVYDTYERIFPPSLSIAREQSIPPSALVMQAIKSEPVDFTVPSQLLGKLPESTLLVPLPEELPPLKEAHDMRDAVLWFVGMVFCLVLLLGPGRM